MKPMTQEEKKDLVLEFIPSDAEPYVGSIVEYIDNKTTDGFEKRWRTITKEVPLSSLNSDPMVSPLAALEETMRALREEGYIEILSMEMNTISVRGYELEDNISFRQRIKYYVDSAINVNGLSKSMTQMKIKQLREELEKLENNLKQLETKVEV